MIARGALAALAAVVAMLALAAPAWGDADVTDADVALRLAPNGDLLVTERLHFNYDGTFEGSYRDIDLLHGEQIGDVSVSQDGQSFSPGGNTALGSHDRPGVFGVTQLGNTVRVVWHYQASDEQRTTVLSYRVRDAVVAYDDVLDIAWAVWGSEWKFDLDHLTASFTNPALDPDDPLYRVWGHPRDVEGQTVRGDGRATLEASDVNSGTAVEMRVTMPRDPNAAYPGAIHAPGAGLPKILADEKGADDDYNSSRNQTQALHRQPRPAAGARDRRARGARDGAADPARPRAPDERPEVPAGAARRRQPGACLRPRP